MYVYMGGERERGRKGEREREREGGREREREGGREEVRPGSNAYPLASDAPPVAGAELGAYLNSLPDSTGRAEWWATEHAIDPAALASRLSNSLSRSLSFSFSCSLSFILSLPRSPSCSFSLSLSLLKCSLAPLAHTRKFNAPFLLR